MATLKLSRPVCQSARGISGIRSCLPLDNRHFSQSPVARGEAQAQEATAAKYPPPPMPLDPNTVSTYREERLLLHHQHRHPIGSRRRRAAIQSSDNVPFEQIPYQCFQEARKVLAEDREEKLAQIELMRKRIATWQAIPQEEIGGSARKKGRLVAMQKHLEHLKILADINDPVIKKRFEDGMGDMNRPIYRYLADRKWRKYARLVLMQRIAQFHLVPDILQHLDPTASVTLGFQRRNVQPGEFVDSRVSEGPARLNVQVYDKGERLVTIAVVDPDVPDIESDSFNSRCHFLAVNVPISPTKSSVPLAHLKKDDHIVQPWLPPFAQKGSPYQRLAVLVLQQDGLEPLDLARLKELWPRRDAWNMNKFVAHHKATAIGATLFRTVWDEGTDGVMARAGVEGVEQELVRKRPEKNPYKKKDGSRYR